MGERRRYASSTDVARLAGVSQSAVSRTYTEGRSVSPQTRAKVLAAAGQLGYRPSLIPRIMLTHRSYLVAIVIGGMYNPFYAAVLEQFAVKLPEIGFQPLLVHVDSGDSLRRDCRVWPATASTPSSAPWRSARPARPGAGEARDPGDRLQHRAAQRMGVVGLRDNEGPAGSSPTCSSSGAAAASASSPGPDPSPASEARLKGFRSGLRAAEPWPSRSRAASRLPLRGGGGSGGAVPRGGRPGRAVLRQRPDRHRCHRRAAPSLGRRVPDDVIVAGFDDIPAASWAAYELTTFVQDSARMVEAVALLLAATASARRSAGVAGPAGVRLVGRRRSTARPTGLAWKLRRGTLVSPPY